MDLLEISKITGGELFGDNVEVDSVSIDSRTISAGQVFLAISGPSFDGNEYALQAQGAGALAVISERKIASLAIPQVVAPYGLQSLALIAGAHRNTLNAKVCAITGSSGKTSVKGMLHSICAQVVDDKTRVVSTYKNFNNHIGVPLTILSASSHTQYLIVEAGTSGKNEIKPLAKIINADVALVNNIGPSHIEGFGTLDAIAQEKSGIYKNTLDNAECILNADDVFYGYFQNICSSHVKRSFSTNSDVSADVYADAIKLDSLGRASFTLNAHYYSVNVSLAVLGEHHVNNALAAASCAISMGIPIAAIKKGLDLFVGEAGRMQCHLFDKLTLIDDTYNANPESMAAAIKFLSRFDQTILVVGDMGELGDIAEDQHQKLGAMAKASGINQLFAIGQYSGCYALGFGDGVQVFKDHGALVNCLRGKSFENTTVLVKGSRSAKMDHVTKALIEIKEAC